MSSELDDANAKSLELEKTRRALWYGLTGRVRNKYIIEYIVNCGGPNEAIKLAEQATLPEIFTGPYYLYTSTLDAQRTISEIYGTQRRAVRVRNAPLAARGMIYEV